MKILLSIFLAAFLFSCSIAKKNQRAVNRVKADINLLNDVGDAWQKLHPCQIDTIIQFKDGKEIISYDTLEISHTDTVYKDNTKIVTDYKTVVKYVNKTDTIFRIQTDKRAEQIALDKINNLEGQNAQLKTENSGLKKESRNRLFWLIGISLFAFFAIGGLTYLLFKK